MLAQATTARLDLPLDPIAALPVGRAVHPRPREHLPWTKNAILWLPI